MKILQKITTPQESVNDDSLLVVKIHVTEGQQVDAGTLLGEFESSKAIIEIPSDVKGYVHIKCRENDEVGVGETIFEITDSPMSPEVVTNTPAAANLKQPAAADVTNQVFSRKALELIEQNKLSKADFAGLAFVDEKIVKERLGQPVSQQASKAAGSGKPKQENGTSTPIPGSVKIEPVKKREIEALSAVNSAGLVSNLCTEVLCSKFDSNISRYQKIISSTPLPLIIFECSRLLPRFKNLNAYFTDNSIVTHTEINIGFAADMGKGLKVLNIKQADKKNLEEIENEMLRLVDAYNEDKLEKSDMTGITFTISDLFISVISNFLPLVNRQNSAIMGISAPDVNRKSFTVSLSFDHRVSNGREVSEFLDALRTRLNVYLNNGTQAQVTDAGPVMACYICQRDASNDENGSIHFLKVQKNQEEKLICSRCFNGK